jgi:hypothetical protein
MYGSRGPAQRHRCLAARRRDGARGAGRFSMGSDVCRGSYPTGVPRADHAWVAQDFPYQPDVPASGTAPELSTVRRTGIGPSPRKPCATQAQSDLDAVSGGSAERSRGMEHPGGDGNGAQTFPVKGEPRRAIFAAVLRGRQARPELRVRRMRSERRGRYGGKARTRQSVARRGPIRKWRRRRDRRTCHFARDPWINRQDVPDRIRLGCVIPPASGPRRRGRDRQERRENEPKGARRTNPI